jgi:hypothetical protein
MRLLGVVLASFSAGFGEITFLALASFYPKYHSPVLCRARVCGDACAILTSVGWSHAGSRCRRGARVREAPACWARWPTWALPSGSGSPPRSPCLPSPLSPYSSLSGTLFRHLRSASVLAVSSLTPCVDVVRVVSCCVSCVSLQFLRFHYGGAKQEEDHLHSRLRRR